MKIGFIGLGKLGLPCALAIESRGHEVIGFDLSPTVRQNIAAKRIPYAEEGAQDLLDASHIQVEDVAEVVRSSEIIFVAVQTPHEAQYEGVTRLPDTRVDFDYGPLVKAITMINEALNTLFVERIVVIVSTVLPGTVDREIVPILSPFIRLCYNPFFIAMGTCIHDFLNPEFVLLGCEDNDAARTVSDFYDSVISAAPVQRMTIREAELTKVAYNVFISQKIVFANTIAEIAEKTDCNSDVVMEALCLATERLISRKYLRAGMGDGGACHPRDCIALSHLSRKLKLRQDIFEDLMEARYGHTVWLADLIMDTAAQAKLPIVILGRSFKKDSNITVGSPAILLLNILAENGYVVTSYDPLLDQAQSFKPSVFFVATDHTAFKNFEFPPASVVLDPWGIVDIGDQMVKLIRIGR
jgi:UDPglucose 6-dehydrogenase